MVDTHTHLYMPEYSTEGQADGSYAGQCAAVDRAVEAGVSMMLMPNVDRASIGPLQALHSLRPESTAMAMGLHPTEVKEDWRSELAHIIDVLRTAPSAYKAIGEAGIDLYWDKSFEREQMMVFEAQVSEAARTGLPLIIHCREGLPQTLEVLQGYRDVKAVFHSFGGTDADVDAIRKVGDYYFGINGIVTFKNSKLRDTLPHIGLERILTETDAPFLAPVPHRGSRNESALMTHVLATVADALGICTDEAGAITTHNANCLFQL